MDARLREEMVAAMRRNGTIRSERVALAFREVPRHRFVPQVDLADAYADHAIAIKSEGVATLASISQPSMLARMLELLDIVRGDRVLEVGTGSGYNAALLACLAGAEGSVVTVEMERDLAERARATLEACGYADVRVVAGDGHAGFEPDAPYDRIVVSARTSDIMPAWWEQLKDGGCIVVPIDVGAGGEYAVGFQKTGAELRSAGVVHCLFLPLRGEESGAARSHVFQRAPSARYASRPRAIGSVVAVRTRDASSDLLERADVVVARPHTTFGVTWA